jgi:hypothetical protein
VAAESTEEVFAPPTALRRRYGPEVEEALVLAWKTLNRICAKRFIPFLPSIVATLEKDGHLELNEEHRGLLLSMSAATADRLLQAHRYTPPLAFRPPKQVPCSNSRSLFGLTESRDEAKPGFLEVDLVAHCGGRLQGGCLYTITLTDVATGWTGQLSSALERSSRFLSWASIPIMVESLSMKKSLPIVCVSRLPLREDALMRNGISALWSRKMGWWCVRWWAMVA